MPDPTETNCDYQHTVGERLERIERWLGFYDHAPPWAPVTRPVILELPCACKDESQDCCEEVQKD